MHLIADRFIVDEEGRAIDAATGEGVRLVVSSAGGVSEQVRWTTRCDALWRLRHKAIAPLVDYGPLSESSRFEAWRVGRPWRGSRGDARASFAALTRVCAAIGLSAFASLTTPAGAASDGSAMWLPDADTGYPRDPELLRAEEIPLSDRGLAIVDRSAVRALNEMFDAPTGRRVQAAALWGPRGAGKALAVREIARMARLRGLVPVSSRLVASQLASLWRDRSLFVIGDAAETDPWTGLLHATVRAPQPHVFLSVGVDEIAGVNGVALDRVPAERLVEALRPIEMEPRLMRIARRQAEAAGGCPGVFARALGLEPRTPGRANAGKSSRHYSLAAEQTAVYGSEESSLECLATQDVGVRPLNETAWPAPGELATLRRRLDTSLGQIAAGRHAPGIRQLRQSLGGLARRHAWADATRGAIALVSALLARGRARDAQHAIEDARTYASRGGLNRALLDIAVLSGDAWIDLARLDEAERVLGAAVTSARAAKDVQRTARSTLSLARCAFWRAEYADGDALLRKLPADLGAHGADELQPPIPGWTMEGIRARQARLAARIAVGLRDVGRAMTLIADARDQATTLADASLIASAACTAAFVHLAVGDLDAVGREVDLAVRSSRDAHDPLCAIKARLLWCEAARRRGQAAVAAAQMRRLGRVALTLPPILRARCDLVTLVLSGDDPVEAAERHSVGTGLRGLSLYVTDHRRNLAVANGADPIVDDIVGVIRACQTAEDESTVLRDVCALVRRQAHAAAVAFVVPIAGRTDILVCDGARLDVAVGARAMAAGITLPPHRHDDRIDAAAPVHYGGERIGALCARWTLGTTDDLSRAAVVLTTSAAAAAPVLSSALARRAQAAAAGPGEFLGVTATMHELRRSVERAAAAPFAVLVDGESGSGKELVARAIHRGSDRRSRPFCTLNCAAMPDDLVEAELFGHARGAFTGAVADRAGVFEEAHGGTLFLDEVGELSARAQAKILRVIQEGELRRVGENISRHVDVRIVAATNRDLPQEVTAGRFRLDLLYRLDVIRITVPPLRERREDIAVLSDHFWRAATQRLGSRATLGAATLAALTRYDWPGNVRELQNVLAALTVRSPKRGVVPPDALPAAFTDAPRREAWRLDDARRTFESRFIRAALVRSGGHRGRAAEELGVTRQGLTKLIARLGIGAE